METGPQGFCQLLSSAVSSGCLAAVVQVLMVCFSGRNKTHRRIKWATQGHRTQSRGDWSASRSVSELLPPSQPSTGLTFFCVFWWSLYLAPSPLFRHFTLFYLISPSVFPLRAVSVPLLCSNCVTIFQLTCQNPYHKLDTVRAHCKCLLAFYSPRQAYEASLWFILILQMREPGYLIYPRTHS